MEKNLERYTRVVDEDSEARQKKTERLLEGYEDIKNGTIKTQKFMRELDKNDFEEDFKEGPGGCGCLLV